MTKLRNSDELTELLLTNQQTRNQYASEIVVKVNVLVDSLPNVTNNYYQISDTRNDIADNFGSIFDGAYTLSGDDNAKIINVEFYKNNQLFATLNDADDLAQTLSYIATSSASAVDYVDAEEKYFNVYYEFTTQW